MEDLDGFKFFLDAPTGDNGAEAWVLLRGSGTEPLLRVYCEAAAPETVNEILDAAVAFVHGNRALTQCSQHLRPRYAPTAARNLGTRSRRIQSSIIDQGLLFANGQLAHHQFVDLEALDVRRPDRQAADGQGSNGERAHGKCAHGNGSDRRGAQPRAAHRHALLHHATGFYDAVRTSIPPCDSGFAL